MRLGAIAQPDGRESNPARGVRFPHEDHSARGEPCGNAGEQHLLVRPRHHLQHVEQQHDLWLAERHGTRIALDDVGILAERGSRQSGDPRSSLDTDHSFEARRLGPSSRPPAGLKPAAGLREQRQRQSLPASNVQERSTRGQALETEGVAIDAVVPQFAARELPGGQAGVAIAVRHGSHHIHELAIVRRRHTSLASASRARLSTLPRLSTGHRSRKMNRRGIL